MGDERQRTTGNQRIQGENPEKRKRQTGGQMDTGEAHKLYHTGEPGSPSSHGDSERITMVTGSSCPGGWGQPRPENRPRPSLPLTGSQMMPDSLSPTSLDVGRGQRLRDVCSLSSSGIPFCSPAAAEIFIARLLFADCFLIKLHYLWAAASTTGAFWIPADPELNRNEVVLLR